MGIVYWYLTAVDNMLLNIFVGNYKLIFLAETILKQNLIGNRLVSTGSDLISLNRAVIQRKQSEYKN